MQKPKKVCIAFLGNAFLDTRIINLTNSLKEDGYIVSVISFDWFSKKKYTNDEGIKVFKINKGKFSPIFYLNFVLILLRELLKKRADIYIAEDIYTLPLVSIIGRTRKARVVFNSREIYSHIGGLSGRPFIQKLISAIEKVFIKRVDLVLTTGEMDSNFIEKKHNIGNTLVIRNLPVYRKPIAPIDFRKKHNLPNDQIILLYQGVILKGRGIGRVIRVMKNLPQTVFIVLGEGEYKESYIKLAQEYGVEDRIYFEGAYPQSELINYTAGGDIGICIIENISLSYYHALPNKLFEYIMAGLPVISSNLPQMKKIIDDYQVGEIVDIEKGELIEVKIKQLIENPKLFSEYKSNCETAAQKLNWQEEYANTKSKLLGIN